MKILIGTKNQGKVEGAKRALSKYFSDFEIEGISVSSDVPEQPVNEQTYMGAKNRVKNLKQYAEENNIKSDFFMAIESGLNNFYGEWYIVNFAVVEDSNGLCSSGTASGFPVPERLVEKIKQIGLSEVMNDTFGKDDERHNKTGGIQLLTHNNISRIDLTESAFVMALTKFVNGENWR